MVENLHKHKEREQDKSHLELVILSAKEVGPALFFSLTIFSLNFIGDGLRDALDPTLNR